MRNSPLGTYYKKTERVQDSKLMESFNKNPEYDFQRYWLRTLKVENYELYYEMVTGKYFKNLK